MSNRDDITARFQELANSEHVRWDEWGRLTENAVIEMNVAHQRIVELETENKRLEGMRQQWLRESDITDHLANENERLREKIRVLRKILEDAFPRVGSQVPGEKP